MGPTIKVTELAQLMADGVAEGEHDRYVRALSHVRQLSVRYDVLTIEQATRLVRVPGRVRMFRPYHDDRYATDYVNPINRKRQPDEKDGRLGEWVEVGCLSGSNELPPGAEPIYTEEVDEVVRFGAVVAALDEFNDFRTRSFNKWLEVNGSTGVAVVEALSAVKAEGRVNRTRLRQGWEFYNPVSGKVRNFDEVFKDLLRTSLLEHQGVLGYLLSDVASAVAQLSPPLTLRKIGQKADKGRPASPGWGPTGDLA